MTLRINQYVTPFKIFYYTALSVLIQFYVESQSELLQFYKVKSFYNLSVPHVQHII